MKELDFLKKDWKKQEENFPRLTYNELYKMIWKRSSSIVRWIFVISILELFLSTFLNIILADDTYWKEMEQLHLKNFTIGLYVVSYCVTFYFIYRFYKNYQRISATDDAATLMKNIIRTRRTVKTYIAYVLTYSGVSGLILSYFMLRNHQAIQQVEDTTKFTYEAIDWVKFLLLGFIVLAIILTVIWLFYRLIYGILLRKLLRNYKELKKLEM